MTNLKLGAEVCELDSRSEETTIISLEDSGIYDFGQMNAVVIEAEESQREPSLSKSFADDVFLSPDSKYCKLEVRLFDRLPQDTLQKFRRCGSILCVLLYLILMIYLLLFGEMAFFLFSFFIAAICVAGYLSIH
ncbi:unnamed protein product [Bursaphelenchus xylophilus]|uniref:(pine wood nematode) hypothetical protein n=1 Tax=Bursaphelenchus xylophilus TaxID=6326 RepID=A0A1I7RZ39_BURXY|nr:unnamed protein product [Bursaphelenchus xylophilus]CAG9106886.1 unnamed protein product [Bursaphelenchus xylophilus]